jgi:hypothetical protein
VAVNPSGFRWRRARNSPNATDRDGHREMIVATGAIHVGGCLTAFVVGVILKQAGLSNQCPAGRERMFVRGHHAEWWALIMRAIK